MVEASAFCEDPDLTLQKKYFQQWLEGEQASFDETPDACHYRISSEEAYWWNQGFNAAEALKDETDMED